METNPQTNEPSRKSGFYYILMWIVLFVMAFTWGLDSSFNFIFGGLALFFFFLGYLNRPRSNLSSGGFEKNYRNERSWQTNSSPSFFSELLAGFQKNSATSNTPFVKAKGMILGVAFFVGAIFFIIITLAILTDDDADPGMEASDSENTIDFSDIARQYYEANNYDSAYYYYKLALRDNRDSPEALLGYGNTLYEMKFPDSTLIYYDRALSANPDFDLARYNKAWIYNDMHQDQRAEAELKALLEKNPAYYDAMLLMGDLYYNRHENTQALTWYEQAYKNGIRTSALLTTMADVYSAQGQNERAIALYKESLTYDSTNVKVYQRLGQMVQGEEGELYRRKAAQQ